MSLECVSAFVCVGEEVFVCGRESVWESAGECVGVSSSALPCSACLPFLAVC